MLCIALQTLLMEEVACKNRSEWSAGLQNPYAGMANPALSQASMSQMGAGHTGLGQLAMKQQIYAPSQVLSTPGQYLQQPFAGHTTRSLTPVQQAQVGPVSAVQQLKAAFVL